VLSEPRGWRRPGTGRLLVTSQVQSNRLTGSYTTYAEIANLPQRFGNILFVSVVLLGRRRLRGVQRIAVILSQWHW
jgi:hypothetical protein